MAVVGILGAPPRVLIIGAGSGEDGCERMQGDSGIVIEDVCDDGMQNLGGRLVLMLMRAGILVGDVVVVAVGVMVVVAVGVISFSGFVSDGGGVFPGGFWAGGR